MKSSVRNELLDQLVSLDEEVVQKALTKLRKVGDHTFVAPLMNTMASTDNELIVANIGQLFFDLKDKPSLDVMIDLLPEEAYTNVRQVLLEACWQSGLDISHRVSSIVSLAVSGNYMECLECLTIIENIESQISEEQLILSIRIIKEYQAEDVTDKEDLLNSMVEVLENFKNG